VQHPGTAGAEAKKYCQCCMHCISYTALHTLQLCCQDFVPIKQSWWLPHAMDHDMVSQSTENSLAGAHSVECQLTLIWLICRQNLFDGCFGWQGLIWHSQWQCEGQRQGRQAAEV